jgi:acyl CoA:acetate/3-ketoacid CoA transferase beta subunit
LFQPTGDGFRILEIAPGVTLDEVHATVGCKLTVPENLPTVRLVG